MQNVFVILPQSVIYEDDRVMVVSASFPITRGHTIAIWKNKVEDLHLLDRKDYEYLMDIVDDVRNVLLEHFKIEKVYLMYLDEAKQVHWHLVPRYDEKGFNIFSHNPTEVYKFPDVEELKILVKNRRL